MEELHIVRRRSRIWIPIAVALVLVALAIAFVLFRDQLPLGNAGWNGVIHYLPLAVSLPLFV